MAVSESSCRILAALLEARTGQQLTQGRRWRIETALRPVLRARGFEAIDPLVAAIAAARDPALADEVVEGLLNNETSFFRDRQAFEQLLGPALARVETSREAQRRIRIWCAGCSTGQEAYSLAMHFAEQAPRWRGWRIEIAGSDVSRTAIEKARAGLYSQFEVQRGLPVRQMMRWFEDRGPKGWQASDALRRLVRFEAGNLIEQPSRPDRYDIILARNVLLYFSSATRRTAFERLHASIAPDGILMLGAGETVIGQTERFVSDPEQRGLYRPVPSVAAARRPAAA